MTLPTLDWSLAAPIANHLWQSTAFAALVSCLALALRNNQARLRYWLWAAASLKFLVPFSCLIAIGSSLEWRTSPILVRDVVSSAMDDVGAPFAPPAIASKAVAAHTSNWPAMIMLGIWALGCALTLVWWFVQWRRMAAVVRSSGPLLEGREAESLRRVQANSALRCPIHLVSSQTSVEPGVFGIFRPTLLLPAGIAGRLSDGQLDAIVAHELCHVRRRDNLAAALHMAIEAIFWFHPLIWWLGARLMEERERACDEQVLHLGSDSRVYAESILKACEFYLQSPVACVSGVTGGELKKRIERIVQHRYAQNLGLPGKLVLAAAALSALAVPVFIGIANAPVARAQSKTSAETFELVSVKPAVPGQRGRGFITDPGRLRMTNVTLKDCILVAYGIQDFQLEGASLPGERYEILAAAPNHPSRILDARYQTMMQALLADRFQLKVHRTSKVLPAYALEIAKGGPKMKESTQPGLSSRSSAGHVQVTGITMLEWATYLTRRIGKPVVDLTGLQTLFDFTLDWSPTEGEMLVEPPDPDKPKPADPSDGPSLYTALQEQLGLKLSSKKLPVEMVVVDRAAKPSEN